VIAYIINNTRRMEEKKVDSEWGMQIYLLVESQLMLLKLCFHLSTHQCVWFKKQPNIAKPT